MPKFNKGVNYLLAQIEEQDTLKQTLINMGIIQRTDQGEVLDLPKLVIYYKIIPIIYNSELPEQEVINLLNGLDLNKVREINSEFERYIYQNPNTLNLTDEEKLKLDLCIIFREVFGISIRDDFINYLDTNYSYNKKLKLVPKKDMKKIEEIKRNIDNTEYQQYTLSSFYGEKNEIIKHIQKLGIVNFSDVVYSYEGKEVRFPSPFKYINAATLVGISCQETCPRGTKTLTLPKDPDKPIINRKNRIQKTMYVTDETKAKLFEVLINSNFIPYGFFAIHDTEVSFGHTQAIERTYRDLVFLNGKPVDFKKLNRNSISKFFNFFKRDEFVNLSDEDKEYLQLPFRFEECVDSKSQILFSYYLSLYNLSKFMEVFMNPNKNLTERSFILANSFSKASEPERFRFICAITAAFHHVGEPAAKAYFQATMNTILPKRKGNSNFEEVLNTMTLDEITSRFIKQLKISASQHAETSMNVGEIISRWQIVEELVSSTASSDTSLVNILENPFKNIRDNFKHFWERLFKKDKDQIVSSEIITEEKEKVSFEYQIGRKRHLIIQSKQTEKDIFNYPKDEVVDYYTFSYPRWASPSFSLSPVLKSSSLINEIFKFNNIKTLISTGDSDSSNPMRTAQVFWVPVDYVKFEGSELGEIIVPNNSKEKLVQVLDEICIGGASDENLRMIQLTSNIFNMNEPNDRLLISYGLLKRPIRNQIEKNSK